MSDKPILFSAPMIRALIEGRKTQTRRAFKGIEQNPNGTWHIFNAGGGVAGVSEADIGKEAPDYLRIQVGDRLWVREAWRCNGWATDVATIFYRASEGNGYSAMCEQYPVADKKPMRVTSTWRPGIHMPRWASRLTLLVTDVRVERLQGISEADATAEGCFKGKASGRVFMNEASMHLGGDEWANARDWYADLWDAINGPGSWEANPWVVAYSFSVSLTNIGRLP